MAAKILLVEDSATMRTFVRGALSADPRLRDAEIVEAESGFEALRLLPRGPYQLVISDINMPDINGLKLLSFIRKNEQHKGTPVLLISTQSSDRDRERGLGLGANAYLAKPFSAESLCGEALRHLASAPQVPPDG